MTAAPRPLKHPLPEARWPTRSEAQQSLLFQPISLGKLRVLRRTWVPAMVPWRATEEGHVTANLMAWYSRFAAGRPGVLVVEATGIREVPSGPLLRIGHERFVPGLQRLVEQVRQSSAAETRLAIQLIDFLRIRRRPEKARFLREYLVLRPEHRTACASLLGAEPASDEALREFMLTLPEEQLHGLLNARELEALQYGAREHIEDVELEHIASLPQSLPPLFAAAAERAQRAGFDAVELHYAHAYTMASFLSRKNMRSDGYGGTRAGRLRLALEVYRAVREAVGRDYCVGCRLLGDEVIAGGSRSEDACYYSVELARAGLDYLSISKGGKFEDARQPKVGEAAYPYTGESGHECMPSVSIKGASPFGRNLELARAVRGAVRAAGYATPVIGAGGIATFDLAEQALREGSCDLVAAARQSLADPDWWLKMELGRGAEIRRCLFTNYCEALDQKHVEVTCQLWDRAEREAVASQSARSRDGKRYLLAPPWSPA